MSSERGRIDHRLHKELRARLDELARTTPGVRRGSDFSADAVRRTIRRLRPPAAAAAPAIVYRRDLPVPQPSVRAPAGPAPAPVALEDAVTGAEIVHPERGAAFLITTPLSDLEGAEEVSGEFRRHLSTPDSGLCRRMAPLCDPEPMVAERICFVDIETTGLSHSPLFLVGAMLWHGEEFEVRQYLARNYAEEAAVIALFAEVCAARPIVVTFNGKSFDMPYIRTRAVATGVRFDQSPIHLDLLHEARRTWRHRLPDCRLQTLESEICHRRRCGDIPGSEIPEAYHEYVRTENARQLVAILRHNARDLITMAELMTRFPPP